MTITITMQPRLGLDAAKPLAAEINAAAGQELHLDASQVTHLGTLCLQVILAAARDWAVSRHGFRLNSPTDICVSQMALYGLSPESLTGGNA